MNKHDIVSSFICTTGVICLSNPLGWKELTNKEIFGLLLAFLSAFVFNLSFISLRKLKNEKVDSWVIVFLIMLMNLILLPPTVFVHN